MYMQPYKFSSHMQDKLYTWNKRLFKLLHINHLETRYEIKECRLKQSIKSLQIRTKVIQDLALKKPKAFTVTVIYTES